MDQNNGLEAKISKGETRILLTIDLAEHLLLPTGIYLQDQTLHMGKTIRIMEDRMVNAEISHSTETMEINNSNGNWRNNGNFSHSPSTQRRDYSQKSSNCQSRSDWPNNSAFRRSDNRPTTSFTPYEQKFPQNNNQTASNVVHFTTTDDTINEISDLCPLNY